MDTSLSKKLSALLQLQEIDTALDALHRLKGELPEEVAELEDEHVGLQTRLNRLQQEQELIEQEITQHQGAAKAADELMRKYTDQQMSIKNSREYDAINKEIELQKIDIKIAEKKIKLCYEQIEEKKAAMEAAHVLLEEKAQQIAEKKQELAEISKENQLQEGKLIQQRTPIIEDMDPRLYTKYQALRNNKQNGRAVVLVHRDACGGCFNQVPPQRQVSIREKRQLTFCEYCGCILAGCEEEAMVEHSA